MLIVVPAPLVLADLLIAAGLLLAILGRLRSPARTRSSAMLLVPGLVVAPVLVLVLASTRMLADMKAVEACGSCPVMDRFVADLLLTAGMTLAARHSRADSMPRDACYACHTGYGVFGSLHARVDGVQHWWKYVMRCGRSPSRPMAAAPMPTACPANRTS